jgi:hypothetical protein
LFTDEKASAFSQQFVIKFNRVARPPNQAYRYSPAAAEHFRELPQINCCSSKSTHTAFACIMPARWRRVKTGLFLLTA